MIDSRLHHIAALALISFCLGACSSSPPATRYVLPQPSLLPGAEARADIRIRLQAAKVPAYARGDAIATLQADGTVARSPTAHWAAPPAEAATRVLAQYLEVATGAAVIVPPIPPAFDPNVRIAVVFDVFARNRDGQAVLRGQFNVTRADGQFVVERFNLVATSGTAYGDYMQATAQGLSQLAALIAATLES